jgi:Reverse transcriptase (RNA-dependent DNA polymerase)
MEDQDKVKWIQAAETGIRSLESNNCWTEVPISDATTKILPGTWTFRRKRNPDEEVQKFNARYCVRGDLQQGQFETYAPVVAWATVRLFLTLSLVLEWKTISIDFANASVQAPLKQPVWIHTTSWISFGFRAQNVSSAQEIVVQVVSGTPVVVSTFVCSPTPPRLRFIAKHN